ncbi:hypothetical protein [Sphingopyxis sp. GW247-27LB]|uniref:hypothetical protein n=1 Tax=Sphingopyxis sp. GW247-27LB TaxID=2012632 RepID=UPI000BA53F39|nr:hypothetical protein [Sphingopyxis sp. GW247-27LB]PAL23587.1 hypothetical protein CD928_05835 [Sphingopyxis sp. GW247-27LB]
MDLPDNTPAVLRRTFERVKYHVIAELSDGTASIAHCVSEASRDRMVAEQLDIMAVHMATGRTFRSGNTIVAVGVREVDQ